MKGFTLGVWGEKARIPLFSPTALGIISMAIFQANFLFKFHHYTQLKGFQSDLSGKSSPIHKNPATIHKNPCHITDVGARHGLKDEAP